VATGRIGTIGLIGGVEGRAEMGDLLGGQHSSLCYAHHKPRRDDPLVGVLVRSAWPEEIPDERLSAFALGDFGDHAGGFENPPAWPRPNSKVPPRAATVSSVVTTAPKSTSARRSS
jgi:hypothetical protein